MNPSPPRPPRALFAALLALFAFMRFWALTERPMHHDEGVVAMFVLGVMRTGFYQYDPANYHGPAFYDLSAAALSAWGRVTDASLRATVVLTDLLTLAGLWLAAFRIGPWGALSALILCGISCDFLFYSRYFIMEPLFVSCTLALYLSLARYRDTKWGPYFYLASAAGGLLFCAKETSVVVLAVMGAACLAAELFDSLLDGASPASAVERLRRALRDWLADFEPVLRPGLLIAASIWLLFFSGFFKNMPGLQDSFRAFGLYARQGTEAHVKPWSYFLDAILIPSEPALLVLSIVGAAAAFARRDKRGLFLAFWAIGIFAAFSAVPYKTPWIVLNVLLPMALLSGYGVDAAFRALPRAGAYALAGAGLALALLQTPQTLRAVYKEYDDDRHPQVYAHTYRDIYRLLKDIDALARRSGQGGSLKVNVVSPEQWPLAYYLRDRPGVLFWGRLEGIGPVDAPLVLAHRGQEAALAPYLKARYSSREYRLRPGVTLRLYENLDYFHETAQ